MGPLLFYNRVKRYERELTFVSSFCINRTKAYKRSSTERLGFSYNRYTSVEKEVHIRKGSFFSKEGVGWDYSFTSFQS